MTPGAPSDVKVLLKGTSVQREWERPENDGGFDILDHRIHKGTTMDDLELYGSTTGTSIRDGKVEADGNCFYKVTAVNGLREGERDGSDIGRVAVPGSALVIMGPPIGVAVAIVLAALIVLLLLMRRRKG